MDTQHDPTEHFHRMTSDLHFAVDDVIDAGTARGRTLRRRRTLTRGLGAVAAVTTLALVTPLAWGQLGGTVDTGGTDAAAPAAPAQHAPTADTVVQRVPGVHNKQVASTLDDLVTALDPSLVVVPNGGTPSRGWNRSAHRGHVTVDDGGGAGIVELFIWPIDVEVPHTEDRCEGDPSFTCSPVAGGTLAVHDQTYTETDGDRIASTEVELLTTDGLRVVAVAENHAGGWPGVEPTRADAPLSVQQLTALVTDPVWIGPAVPVELYEQRPLGTWALDADETLSTLRAMIVEALPGVSVTEPDDAPSAGRHHLLVDDGEGASYVTLLVSLPEANFTYETILNGYPECLATCTETEDGRLDTAERADDGKDDEVGVWNSASYQRADGVSVTVLSTNTAVPPHEATTTSRRSPLLGVELLARIVQSDVWVD